MATAARRVLGLDPGLTRCGIGVVDGPVGAPTLVAAECLRTPKELPTEQRLAALHDGIAAAIAEHRPHAVAVERVLFSVNVHSAMATGQAAGIALLCAAQAGLAVTAYSPNEVKAAVAGHGSADKDAVGRMVAAQLRLAEVPRPPDVADALAIALTHLVHGGIAAATHRAGPTPAGTAAAPTSPAATGWEAHLAARGLQVVGGTAEPEGGRP